jgi:putative aldouronate transport system permease protein
MDISYFGYRLVPKNIDFTSYKFIFKTPQMIIDSYIISIVITVLGTLTGVILTCAIAYPMTRKDYRYSKVITFMVVIPLLIQGGLVPWYILISRILDLRDTIWVLFLPYTVVPWFAMLAKGFLSNIPFDVIESAKIDGAGEIRIFFKMILPMSKPGLRPLHYFARSCFGMTGGYLYCISIIRN